MNIYSMKDILFISTYINNAHFIGMLDKSLKKHLKCSYDLLVLNDAPKTQEENYLQMSSIITNNPYPFAEIEEETERFGCLYIPIPQNIHIQNRPNHSSYRHCEILNWFFQNLELLFPSYTDYKYICIIDSDVALVKDVDIMSVLEGYDMAAPLIYLSEKEFYPHVGLFFINLHTVINFKTMNFSITKTDTGSGLLNFIAQNPSYKIKEIGRFDGFIGPNGLCKGDFHKGHVCDRWLDDCFFHFRSGSNFGVSAKKHKTMEGVKEYLDKLRFFDVQIEYDYWLEKAKLYSTR